jgi:hypothetical protein
MRLMAMTQRAARGTRVRLRLLKANRPIHLFRLIWATALHKKLAREMIPVFELRCLK